jgi:hypothetical protein
MAAHKKKIAGRERLTALDGCRHRRTQFISDQNGGLRRTISSMVERNEPVLAGVVAVCTANESWQTSHSMGWDTSNQRMAPATKLNISQFPEAIDSTRNY